MLLLTGGVVALAVAVGIYLGYAFTHPRPYWLDPVDLRVYRLGGFIAAHVPPWYQPRRVSPLYDWPGYLNLKFTYTPFAALLFTALTVPPRAVLVGASVAVNIVALVAAVWFTLGGIVRERAGRESRGTLAARAGGTLLLAAVLFWTEPVQRTLYLGQVDLILLALIMWDTCQPDRRWWKGAGIGIAAGVKLVPLIFIAYLLLTRRFRQAAVAAGTFACTVALGFFLLPRDSIRWWLHGTFLRGGRTGFIGWEGNQSLSAVITRFAGSIAAGHGLWVAVATVTVLAGLAAGAVIDRAGFPVAGILTCALAGVLASPISWDHHWVWIVPGVTALVGYAMRLGTQRLLAVRRALITAGVVVTVAFAAWPCTLLVGRRVLSGFTLGLIWVPQNTNPGTYDQLGDKPWYAEYHWHGADLLAGNLYVLTGLAALSALIVVALTLARGARRPQAQSTARPSAAASSTAGATIS